MQKTNKPVLPSALNLTQIKKRQVTIRVRAVTFLLLYSILVILMWYFGPSRSDLKDPAMGIGIAIGIALFGLFWVWCYSCDLWHHYAVLEKQYCWELNHFIGRQDISQHYRDEVLAMGREFRVHDLHVLKRFASDMDDWDQKKGERLRQEVQCKKLYGIEVSDAV